MNNLEAQFEHHLTPMIQEKFELLIKKMATGQNIITEEYMMKIRAYIQTVYQEGLNDRFTEIKEIYNNDVDAFIGLFEEK